MSDGHAGVSGNERLTALAGALLLILLGVELVTAVNLGALMSAHLFVGVLLTGPLVAKLGSTGYRFLRYYTGAPAYVRKGPPRLPLRLLAVPLVATTVLLVGSGGALLLTGPDHAGPLVALHNLSTLIWLPLVAVHAVAYLRRSLELIAADSPVASHVRTTASELRLGVSAGALVAGVVAAFLLLPTGTPWLAWAQTNDQVSAPVIVGLVLAVVVLLATRPLRWTSASE